MPVIVEKNKIQWGGLNLEVAARRKETSTERNARYKRDAAKNDKFRADADELKVDKRCRSEHAEVYARIKAEDFGAWFESVTGKEWNKVWERNFCKIQEELDWADGLVNELKSVREYAKLSLRDFSKMSHQQRSKMRMALATPELVDREAMKGVYMECSRKSLITGVRHHVEHVVPIDGELVCGFHVQTNLRIVAYNA